MQEKAMSNAAKGELDLGCCGFKALVVLQRRYDVHTQSGMLRAFGVVARPAAIKNDSQVITAINEWEQRMSGYRKYWMQD